MTRSLWPSTPTSPARRYPTLPRHAACHGRHRPASSRRWIHALVLGLAGLPGCGHDGLATVHGVVTVDGSPVSTGLVFFRNDSKMLVGTIGPDGRYALSFRGRPRVPGGDYGVALMPPERPIEVDPRTGRVMAPPTADEKNYPPRFRYSETSGVSRRITRGDITMDIDFSTRAPEAGQ